MYVSMCDCISLSVCVLIRCLAVHMCLQVLYENMLTELPFASFFLSKLLSSQKGDVDIHHLASLDPEMYRCRMVQMCNSNHRNNNVIIKLLILG